MLCLLLLLAVASPFATAQPVYQSQTQATGSSTGTGTLAAPAGSANGDMLIAVISTDGNTTITPSTGWTLVKSGNSAGEVTMAIYARLRNAADTAYSFSWTGGTERYVATIMRFTNTGTVASVVTASAISTGASTNALAPATNTIQVNSKVLRIAAIDVQTATTPGLTNITTTASGGGGNGIGTAIGHINQAGVGTTGTYNFTNANDQWVAATVVIKPPEPAVAFRITHSGSTTTCSTIDVTFTAVDQYGTIVTGFTGTVTVVAPNGDWSVVSAANGGFFFNDTPGNGDFTYTFIAGDAGDIVMRYSPTVSGTLNLDISGGGITETSHAQGFDQNITTALCGYTLSHDGFLGTCDPYELITIRAVQPDGTTLRAGYTGTVTINTSTTTGTWALGTASGSINNLGNGNIEYTFNAAENGQTVLRFTHAAVGTVNFDLYDTRDTSQNADLGTDPVLNVTLCGFTITHDGTSGTCGYEFLTLTSTSASFNGTAYVTTSTTDGTWELQSGGGTLTPLANGNFSYSFNAAVNGTNHVFRYRQPTAAAVDYQISTIATGNNDANVGGSSTLTVTPCTFIITPPGGSPNNCSINNVTIGVRDGSSNAVNGYTGTVTLSTDTMVGLWSQGTATNAPNNNPTPGDGSATILFALADAGTVVLGLSHDDPGLVTVDANDATNSITTSSSPAFNLDACAFWVSFTGPGDTCTPTDITIEARAGATLLTSYVGTATITTDTGNGDWTLGGATNTATFTNFGNGSAEYYFSPSDNGTVTLEFSDTIVENVNFDVTDGLLVVDSGHDPSLDVQACRFLISLGSSSTDLCTPESVTFTLVDSADNPVTDYTGQIFISSSFSGTWTNGTTTGINDTGGGNANYQFQLSDMGTASFNFQGSTINTYNFDVTDGSNSEIDGDPVEDPDLDITACLPAISDFSCVNAGSTSITIPSAAETLNTRAVVMVTGYEGQTHISSATFNGTAASGTLYSIENNTNPTNQHTTSEMFVWLDSDLPSASGSYSGAFTTNDGQAMCLVALKNVEQVVPSATRVGTNFADGGTISSSLTSPATNTIVISGAAVDELGGFGVNSLGNQFGNFSVAADSWSFASGWGVVNAGPLTVTENFLGTVDKWTAGTAAFAPAPAPLAYFAITHDGGSTSCTMQSVTITAYDVNGNVKSNYVGTITLSTDVNNGNWFINTGNGILADTANDDDGMATYQFDIADSGTVTLNFLDPHNETIDFAVADGSITDDGSHSTLLVNSCEPVITATQCFAGNAGSVAIVGSDTSTARAVILTLAFEGTTGQAVSPAPTFNAQAMSPVVAAGALAGGLLNRTEMYVILDANLPSAAGTYGATFTDPGGNTPAMCLTAVYGIEQVVPVSPAVASGTVTVSATTSTLSVTTAGNNALIVSAITDDRAGGNYTSTLDTALWNNETPPAGSVFSGFAGYKAQAGPESITMTASAAATRLAHIAASFSPVVAGPPTADDYVPVTLFKTFSGKIDYRAYGRTNRLFPNGDNVQACTYVDPLVGTSINVDVPTSSIVVGAYLYWSGSGDDDLGQTDADVTLVDPSLVEFDLTAEDIFLIRNVGGGNNLDYFTGYKDVTTIVTGNGTYTLKNMTAQGGVPWQLTSACASGWALVVVFENTLQDLHAINIFHGFQPFQNNTIELVPRNFRVRASDGPGLGVPHGQFSHITIEGDDNISSTNERFGLEDAPNSGTFGYLTNVFNPAGSQYNSTVVRPVYDGSLNFTGVYESLYPAVLGLEGDSFGVDVDTYFLDGDDFGEPLYNFGLATPQPETITTEFSAGQDLVLLVAEVFTVTNAPIADLEVTITEGSEFIVGGTSSYTISLLNHGDLNGPDGSMTGSATVTVTLPDGLTISGITATGWTCVFNNAPPATPLGLAALACEYDISTPLAENDSLPNIVVGINIGDETKFPNVTNPEEVVVRALYHGGNCSPNPLTDTLATFGESPDPPDCGVSPQFDNIQDLENGALSMNDLVEKSVSSNNNVDRVTTTINGRKTDLQITKVAGVLQEASAGTYTITVTNLGPQVATKLITVTDTLPAGLTFQGFAENGDNDAWSCGAVGQLVTCTTDTDLGLAETADFFMGVLLSAPAVENAPVNNTACVAIAPGNFDTLNGNDCYPESSVVQGEPVVAQNKFLISVNLDGTQLGSGTATVTFNIDDIILFDPATDGATMFYDDSAVNGDQSADINALHVRKNGHIIMSPVSDGSSVAGVTYDSGDLLVYDPILDSAVILFDGSTVFNGGIGNIDAVYEEDDGDLVISTAESTGIGATTWQRGDLVEINGTTPTISTVLLDGDSAAVFNADVQLNGVYFKTGATPDYVITIGQSTANIATGNTTVTGDDIASLKPLVDSQLEFRGSVPPGVFSPLLSTRFIDAVHIVEDGYFGHFSITESVSGDTCTPTSVIIRKHTSAHVLDSTYTGSIRISTAYGGTATLTVTSGNGTLQHLTGNNYVYTYVPADNGAVTLAVTVIEDGASLNLNVTNGLRTESATEDPILTFNDTVSAVTYGDNFTSNSFSGSSGTSSWAGNWQETDADSPGASTGNVRVVSGEAYFDNTPNAVDNSGGGNDDLMPALVRAVDLSLYSLDDPLVLTYNWRTVGANTGDSFTVEVRGSSVDPWLPVTTYTGLSGTNSGSGNFNLSTILSGGSQTVTATTAIRFRVEDNYDVTGNFIIDNVLLTTGTADCGVGAVHHYDIIHAGSGVMCEAYPITFIAHDVAHTPVAPGLNTVVNLGTSTGQGSWSAYPGFASLVDVSPGDGLATYTFGLSQTQFTANFNLTAPNVSTATATINFNIAQGALTEQSTTTPVDPDFTFYQAGFIYTDAPLSSNKLLGHQIAGKLSSTLPSNPVYIRAVRTSDDFQSCLALFQNQTVTVEMGAECKDPAACLAGTVSVVEADLSVQALPTNTDDGNANTVVADVPVALAFDANGEAQIEMSYDDAGLIQLYTEYNIRLNNDPSGLQSGDIMRGVSNPIVVRPFGFNIDLSANGTQTFSIDSNGTAFRKAGEAFALNIQAVTYDAADDLDFDGAPDVGADLVTGNALTPNFGNVSITPTVTVTPVLVAPLSGTLGTLLGTTSYTSFTAGQEQHTDVSYDEVGIIDLAANLADYLNDTSADITGQVQNVGRFTPDHYTITSSPHLDRSDFGAVCSPASTFTYMGEQLQLTINVEARKPDNSLTRNYFDGFEKLTSTLGGMNYSALDLDTLDLLTARLDSSAMNVFTWGNVPGGGGDTGTGVISGTLVLDKDAAPDGPYNMFTVGSLPVDADGVTLLPVDLNLDIPPLGSTDTLTILTTGMRFGRMTVNSTGGSEISISPVAGAGLDIPITFDLEYYDSNLANFLINGIDDCTTLDSSHLSVVSGSYTDGLAFDGIGPTTSAISVNVGVQTGTITVLQAGRTRSASTGGDMPFYISSPFDSDAATTATGSLLLEYDLDGTVDADDGAPVQNVIYDYLKFDWRNEGSADPYDENPAGAEDNPRAIIDFGSFQGHNRVINWQEILLTPTP